MQSKCKHGYADSFVHIRRTVLCTRVGILLLALDNFFQHWRYHHCLLATVSATVFFSHPRWPQARGHPTLQAIWRQSSEGKTFMAERTREKKNSGSEESLFTQALLAFMCLIGTHSKEKFDGESFILKHTSPDKFPITNAGWYTNGFQLFIYTVNTERLLGKHGVSGKAKEEVKIARANRCVGCLLAPCASCRQLKHADLCLS